MERAVQELELELLRQHPHGGPVSPVVLSFATATLNSLSGIVSSRNVDTARSVLKYPDSTTGGDYDLISPSSEPP